MVRAGSFSNSRISLTVENSNNMLEKFTTAMGYLEFYDSADVLCLDRKYIPPQLSDISFTSDLSGLVDVR